MGGTRAKGGRIRSKGGRHASTAGGTKLDTLSQADGVRTAWLNLALGTHTVLGLHAGGEETEAKNRAADSGGERGTGAVHSPVGGREGRKEGRGGRGASAGRMSSAGSEKARSALVWRDGSTP